MNGYDEAAKIDERISKLLHEQPINKTSAHEWLNFARTVKTSCKILEDQALKERFGK